MIKLEMHAHSKYGSDCAHETPKTIAEIYKNAGYGGVVLTNHYCDMFFKNYKGVTKNEKLDFYFSLYEDFSTELKKVGLKPFLGAEIRAYDAEDYFTEYLIYGFEKSFLYDNVELFKLTQKQLFTLCEEKKVFMCESHPFRRGVKVGYYANMHGVEAYNGHMWHKNNNELAEAYAKAFNLKMLSGTDFHDAAQSPKGGIFVPENITTDRELADYLFAYQVEIIKD